MSRAQGPLRMRFAPWHGAVLTVMLCSAACTYDYDQFDTSLDSAAEEASSVGGHQGQGGWAADGTVDGSPPDVSMEADALDEGDVSVADGNDGDVSHEPMVDADAHGERDAPLEHDEMDAAVEGAVEGAADADDSSDADAGPCPQCHLPHAQVTCDEGCSIDRCLPGYADCNGSILDGCETQISADPMHCGTCDKGCSFDNARSGCIQGLCVLSVCTPGYGDCDSNPVNGCEVLFASDVENCGACGRACSGAQVASRVCANGVCTSTCVEGSGNCIVPATGPDDGCETSTRNNDLNCGGCGNSCSRLGGATGLSCSAEGGDACGCVSDRTCGLAGAIGVCEPISGTCSCQGASCRPGEACIRKDESLACSCRGGSSCASDETCCESPAGCQPLQRDPRNCGACGHACAGGLSCDAGLCVCRFDFECSAGGAGTCSPSGRCSCQGTVCKSGERCLPSGTCG